MVETMEEKYHIYSECYTKIKLVFAGITSVLIAKISNIKKITGNVIIKLDHSLISDDTVTKLSNSGRQL